MALEVHHDRVNDTRRIGLFTDAQSGPNLISSMLSRYQTSTKLVADMIIEKCKMLSGPTEM